MPRPGPRRPLVALRLGEAEIAALDELAAERGENRSETVRAMLAYAQRRMPRGWQPK